MQLKLRSGMSLKALFYITVESILSGFIYLFIYLFMNAYPG